MLGVNLDQRLNWDEQCKTLRGKAFRALSALRPLFMSSLPLHTKLLVYNAFIRPLMTYASPVWAFISKTNMNRLQVVQNKAFRIIGGYDWYTRTEQLHFDNEILMLKSLLKNWPQNCMRLLRPPEINISKNWDQTQWF